MDCANPITVKTEEGYIEVPCGCCMLCRIARTREWSTRLLFENSTWSRSVFITLTYDDDHIPITGCGVATLYKPDLQNFFKRLRARLDDGQAIKYFACGEYGDHTHRPHFHSIIFGLGPSDLSLFQKCWTNGFVSVGGVSPESINYVTGYVRKKMIKKSAKPEDFGCLHRLPEFQLQSQGLGLKFYEQNRDHILSSLSLRIQGHREAIPRYFLKKDNEAKNLMSACNRAFNPRIENLRRAQQILNKRDTSKDILKEMVRSKKQKLRTLAAENSLFKKGTV